MEKLGWEPRTEGCDPTPTHGRLNEEIERVAVECGRLYAARNDLRELTLRMVGINEEAPRKLDDPTPTTAMVYPDLVRLGNSISEVSGVVDELMAYVRKLQEL